MWGAGLVVSRRGRHVKAVVEQAEHAERAREAQTRKALAEERATIARELHDVVSHGLSVVIVQTLAARGVLSDVHAAAAGEVDRHLEAVESTARDALGEMRRMLGLLHNVSEATDPGDDASSPAPGLRHLDDLVARVAAGGTRTRLHVDSDLQLPAGLDLAIYRITQEGLTNVVKHAPGAAVDVDVRKDRDQLLVTVSNGPSQAQAVNPPRGAARGLLGVRERAALYGGTVTVGPTSAGGFALTVAFPATTHDPTPATDRALR
jgi:signal transduction histidine kinase